MKTNVFFKNKGPIKLEKIINECCPISFPKNTSLNIFDIKDLLSASNKDITFLNSSKYKELSINTKAIACITTEKLQKFLPNECNPIIVEDLMLNLAKVTKLFYPDAQMDRIDNTLISSDKIKSLFDKSFKNVNYRKLSFTSLNIDEAVLLYKKSKIIGDLKY